MDLTKESKLYSSSTPKNANKLLSIKFTSVGVDLGKIIVDIDVSHLLLEIL